MPKDVIEKILEKNNPIPHAKLALPEIQKEWEDIIEEIETETTRDDPRTNKENFGKSTSQLLQEANRKNIPLC